jgi:radical SAM protein with 4Fe4S-binding SPASM domain
VLDDAINTIPAEQLEKYYRAVLQTADELGVRVVHGRIGLMDFHKVGGTSDQWLFPRKDCGMKTADVRSEGVWTCSWLWNIPFITTDGFVTPCCLKPDQSLYNLGDIKKDSFEDIWHGKQYQWLRERHISSNHPDPCKYCQELKRIV